MLVLALDTATSLVSAVSCEVGPRAVDVRARWVAREPQRHGELAAVALREVLAAAGAGPRDVDALVVGLGPGPFTGLRVGIATAAAFGDARGAPVHGGCTLDALAVAGSVVVSDARRRELYWARFDDAGVRTEGPDVARPADLAARLRHDPAPVVLGPGAAQHRDAFDGLDVRDGPATVPVERLVALLADRLRAGSPPEPLRPLYLRRPDAVPAPARTAVRS